MTRITDIYVSATGFSKIRLPSIFEVEDSIHSVTTKYLLDFIIRLLAVKNSVLPTTFELRSAIVLLK